MQTYTPTFRSRMATLFYIRDCPETKESRNFIFTLKCFNGSDIFEHFAIFGIGIVVEDYNIYDVEQTYTYLSICLSDDCRRLHQTQ
jgi:hypothetical protein